MRMTSLRGLFVTGTDTEVGKTAVSTALLHALAAQGRRWAGYKPIAAGTRMVDGVPLNDDVADLQRASSVEVSTAEVGPLQFETACAPHIAAAIEHRAIDRAALLAGAQALAARADGVLVEGVGGFCVPLTEDWDTADLAVDLGLPVLLVVGLRLGCLNHALLTAEAVERRGLRLAGWVANGAGPAFAYCGENVDTLRQALQRRHGTVCLGVVPRLEAPDPAAIAAHLDAAALAAIVTREIS